MFSRPVSSGWKPVPTSSSAPTRPRVRETPEVGYVIRASILRSVVLPAPFGPMTPTTSSFGHLEAHVAQRPDASSGDSRKARAARASPASREASVATEVRRDGSACSDPLTSITVCHSHQVRERALDACEAEQASDEDDGDAEARRAPRVPAPARRRSTSGTRRHRRHRVQRVDVLPGALDERARVHDRAREEPELEHRAEARGARRGSGRSARTSGKPTATTTSIAATTQSGVRTTAQLGVTP